MVAMCSDEPLAPIVQRDADAHAQGCTCPACGGGFDDAPAAPLIQRAWTDSQETEEDEGSETTGGWTDQAQQTEHGDAVQRDGRCPLPRLSSVDLPQIISRSYTGGKGILSRPYPDE
ncbi:MAG: hypothetical protein JNL34_09745 [Anaerolineae bacterium]|nr:hypothetical protein [Anaerolineae bacterium]